MIPQDSIQTIASVRILHVMATEHECTPALRALIAPLITGVGPVEAGVALGAALGALDAKGQAPDVIIALGSSGSRTLDHAGIYQASHVSYRDMDCSPLGFPRGVTPFSAEPAVFDLGPALPGLRQASLSSGGGIVSGADYDAVGADMVDMETYSYARAARMFGKRLIVLRGVSDGREPLSGKLTDWTETLEEIGLGLASALNIAHAEIAQR
jgi:adenosylhomocysteine nucleosidase